MASAASKQLKQRRDKRRARKFAIIRHIIAPLLVPVLKLWIRTWRMEYDDSSSFARLTNSSRPIIAAVLHGQLICLVGMIYRKPVGTPIHCTTMTSPSRDGQLLAYVLRRFGQQTVTGSSKRRGITALLELRAQVRQGRIAAIAIDGPRGPRGVPNAGVFTLARSTNANLYVVLCRASRTIQFRSWDKAILPLPFSRVYYKLVPFRDYTNAPRKEDPQPDLVALQKVFVDHLRKSGECTDDIIELEENNTNA